jgi:hypothetical protein
MRKLDFKKKYSEGLPGGPNELNVSIHGYKITSSDRFNPYNIIPSGNITMEDVPHPVFGIDNLGNQQMMYPGMNYTFPGNEVFELPIKQTGGQRPTLFVDPNDPAGRARYNAYNDSLSAYKNMYKYFDMSRGVPRYINQYDGDNTPVFHTVADEVNFYKKNPKHGWAYYNEKDYLNKFRIAALSNKVLPEKIVNWIPADYNKDAIKNLDSYNQLGLGIPVYKKPTQPVKYKPDPEIVAKQQQLIDAGFKIGKADGIWGDKSQKAWEEFQNKSKQDVVEEQQSATIEETPTNSSSATKREPLKEPKQLHKEWNPYTRKFEAMSPKQHRELSKLHTKQQPMPENWQGEKLDAISKNPIENSKEKSIYAEYQTGGNTSRGQNVYIKMPDGSVKYVNTDSEEYREMYNSGRLASTPDGENYIFPDLPDVNIEADRRDWLGEGADALRAFAYSPLAASAAAFQVPQSLMVEGVEALRGNPYDFKKALDANILNRPVNQMFESEQRTPGEVWGYENPEGFLQNAVNFGLDMIDPSLMAGVAGAGRKVLQKGLKSVGKKLPGSPNASSVDDVGKVFNNRAQNDLLIEQARRSRERPVLSHMEPYISKRYIPATKEQEIFESFLSPKKQAELRKSRTQTFTAEEAKALENNSKSEYQQGGSIELELNPEEIEWYKSQGYEVEEIPEYKNGGVVELELSDDEIEEYKKLGYKIEFI